MSSSKEEVALRVAAKEWADSLSAPVTDQHDSAGQRANAKLMKAASKLAGMAKRGYSREFTPKTERRVQIVIDRVPPTLKDAVDAKAKREGISVRALVLTLLKDWLAR
jgi:predicted HicB family RNase H-like nuclease